MVRDVRPVLGEHGAGERLDLGVPSDSHPGALEAEIETADSAEQRADSHFIPLSQRSHCRASSRACMLSRVPSLLLRRHRPQSSACSK